MHAASPPPLPDPEPLPLLDPEPLPLLDPEPLPLLPLPEPELPPLLDPELPPLLEPEPPPLLEPEPLPLLDPELLPLLGPELPPAESVPASVGWRVPFVPEQPKEQANAADVRHRANVLAVKRVCMDLSFWMRGGSLRSPLYLASL
jgi:hypothetical protein